MEIADIKKDVQRIEPGSLYCKAETKSCVSWIGPNGEVNYLSTLGEG